MRTMVRFTIFRCLLIVTLGSLSAADIVAYWPLNGNPQDLSAIGKNDGVLIGGNWTQGMDGAGLHLTGANQYVKIAEPNGLDNASFSVAFWCKIDSWNEWYNTAISFGGEDRGWACKQIEGSGSWMFVHRGNPETDWRTSGPSIDIGQWGHFAVSWDNITKEFRWYKNGEAVGEPRSLPGHMMKYSLTDPINIGACSQGGSHQFLAGTMGDCIVDEVYLFDGAIDAATVARLYTMGLEGDTLASEPSPDNGAFNVPEGDVKLIWTPGAFGDPNLSDPNNPVVIEHHLYWGTDKAAVQNADPDNDPIGVYKGIVTLPATVSIAKDQTYYWRVDEVVEQHVIRGLVWSFDSEKTVPIITQHPHDTMAFAGETVTFHVAASSPSALAYQWRKNGTSINDEPGHFSGSQTATLVIVNVSDADEAAYSCLVSNVAGDVVSNDARLTLKKLLGHWPLDEIVGDPNITLDTSGNGNDALLVNGPTLTEGPGSDNNAMWFETSLQTRLEIPNESFFDVYNKFTVSAWIKTMWDGGDWRGIVTKSGENGGWALRRYSNTTDPTLTLRGTSAGDDIRSGRSVRDLEWHLVTATYDGNSRKIYVDGDLVVVVEDHGFVEANDAPVVIGCTTRMDGSEISAYDAFYTGGIDDVRIYNYALTPEEVAALYVDVMGGIKCVEHPAMDFNGDCIIDMSDFVEFASQFMECNLVPDCAN
jgi:hypothetical protein